MLELTQKMLNKVQVEHDVDVAQHSLQRGTTATNLRRQQQQQLLLLLLAPVLVFVHLSVV